MTGMGNQFPESKLFFVKFLLVSEIFWETIVIIADVQNAIMDFQCSETVPICQISTNMLLGPWEECLQVVFLLKQREGLLFSQDV